MKNGQPVAYNPEGDIGGYRIDKDKKHRDYKF
jgi:hypothetical protein